MPSRKGSRNVNSLVTRDKYRQMCVDFGIDPMAELFMIIANQNAEPEHRIAAIREVMKYGEQRQPIAIQLDTVVDGKIEVTFQQPDMLGAVIDQRPELIGTQ